MLGSALYFPYIDIDDKSWLRSALLFWDDIQTIVPSSIHKPYRNNDTLACFKEGYLRPLHCDLQKDLIEDLGQKIIKLAKDKNDLKTVLDPTNSGPIEEVFLHSDKLHQSFAPEIIRYAKLSNQKMSSEMAALFGKKTGTGANVDWLLVDSRFATIYMTALAALLAKEANLSPLTNVAAAAGLNIRSLVGDVASNSTHASQGALLTVVTKNLVVDPDTSIKKILKFRHERRHQLAELGGKLESLKSSIEKAADLHEAQEKSKKIYVNEISPSLDKLRLELRDQAIGSVWDGFQAGTAVSIAPSTAFWAVGVPSSIVLAAGACITAVGIGVKSYLGRSKVRRASPYTYLFDAHRRFGV